MKSKTIVYEQKHSKNRFTNITKELINKIEKIKYRTIFKATLWVVVALTCINLAYEQRGYFAIGGETLVIPLAILFKEIVGELLEIKKGDGDVE